LLPLPFPVGVHKFAVVVARLKNRRVRQLLFQTAGTHCINFFFMHVSQYLEAFLSAVGAPVWTIDHFCGIFHENLDAVVRGFVGFVKRTHILLPARFGASFNGKSET